MNSDQNKLKLFFESLSEAQKENMIQLRNVIYENLPNGFDEVLKNDYIQYVMPISVYPKGYHVKKGMPLPFIELKAQKHNISLYHYGIYMDLDLLKWYRETYKKMFSKEPDMGKSCLRFKHVDQQVLSLVKQLVEKKELKDYIALYESKR